MSSTLNNAMCRCCASQGTFKDLKTSFHWMGEEEIYSEMLRECFDITLYSTDDGDDGGICEVCITQLRNAANFKKQVQHTEEEFQRRVRDGLYKYNIVKEEVSRDDEEPEVESENENNMDDDFSGNDFEVPIKEESEPEEQRPKKRAAPRAAASRAKKPKADAGAPSTKRAKGTRTITIERRPKIEVTWKSKLGILSCSSSFTRIDLAQNIENLKHILLNSNANPIRRKDGKGYGCALCTKTYPAPVNLKRHFLEEHNNDNLIKRVVKKLFDMVLKLDITNLNCALCDLDIDKLEDFIEHLKVQHNKPMFANYKNQIVPFKFDTEEMRCAVCSTSFATFKLLQEHMNVHYRNFICTVCSNGFVTEKLLSSHVKRHATGEYKCEECDKTFSNETKRREHSKRTHLGFRKRNKCKFCDERFDDYWKKIDHQVKVHGMPPVVLSCQACDRTFDNQRALGRHTRKDHLMEKKHQCKECEMNFFSSGSLKRHMAKHTGLKLYQCDVCFKAYGRRNTLREHMRIHMDDRRFACAVCGQAFVQKCSWRGHMRSRHGQVV